MNKFEFLARKISVAGTQKGDLSLLDVGCRTCDLKPYLDPAFRYEGVDLFQNKCGTVDHVHDVSTGLPFEDKSFDFVVALDLLEHLDDLKHGLDEFSRVAKGAVFVMLPNMANIFFRLRFLAKGRFSGKYDLTYGYGKDRHRWLTTTEQCDSYMRAYAKDNSLSLSVFNFNDTPKKIAFAHIAKAVGISPNVWAWSSLYILAPSREAQP